MIVINAKITADQATVAALAEAIGKMERASLEEPGCSEYCFSVEVSNPSVFRITERWNSVEDLKAHFATPHMAEFQAAMAANPSQGTEIHCYEAEEIPFPAM